MRHATRLARGLGGDTRLGRTTHDAPKTVTRRRARDASERGDVLQRSHAAVRDPKGSRKSNPRREVDRLWSAYRRRDNDDTRNRLVEAYQSLLGDVVRRFMMRLPR